MAVIKDRKAVQMHRSHRIGGVVVSFSRSIIGWVACFGPDYFVHFHHRPPVWVARRPMALETLCAARTLTAAVLLVRAHYDAIQRDAEARIAARLKAVR